MAGIFSPSLLKFQQDPFGYALLGWVRLQFLAEANGFEGDPTLLPTNTDLKSPILWLSQAHALSEAATLILTQKPNESTFQKGLGGIFDGHFRAVGLMLVGYSLEVCLKAILILHLGPERYQTEAKETHLLTELAQYIHDLTDREKSVLKVLSSFSIWAGKYPAPKERYHAEHEEIFKISQEQQLSLKDVVGVAEKIMSYARKSAEAI